MATAVPASTSYSPGQGSQATLVRDVLNFFGLVGDEEINATAATAINAGIGLLNSRNWKKITNSSVITLAADTESYGLPSDFKDPIVLQPLNTSSKRDGRIPYKTLQRLMQEHTDGTSSSDPSYYTVDYNARKIIFDSPTSSTYIAKYPTMRTYYHRRVPKLTTGAATTGLPPEFDEWLVIKAARWLAPKLEPSMMQMLDAEHSERWQWLRTSDNAQITDEDQ